MWLPIRPRTPPTWSATVPVQQHAHQEGERVAAQQVVTGGVLGDAESRHTRDVAVHRFLRNRFPWAGGRADERVVAVPRCSAISHRFTGEVSCGCCSSTAAD